MGTFGDQPLFQDPGKGGEVGLGLYYTLDQRGSEHTVGNSGKFGLPHVSRRPGIEMRQCSSRKKEKKRFFF